MAMGVEKKKDVKIYRKLDTLPMGIMMEMHQVRQLDEHDQGKVLLSLVVSKGAHKFNKMN